MCPDFMCVLNFCGSTFACSAFKEPLFSAYLFMNSLCQDKNAGPACALPPEAKSPCVPA